jgi:hypothetical protein
MPRDEPFIRIVKFAQTERRERIQALAAGQWQGEAEARELVGRIASLDAILHEMETVAGPGTHFGEADL